MDPNASSVHPQQALAVYAESLVAGARVVVFGDASLGLGARLMELGARGVQLWDPDPERARAEAEQTPHGVTVDVYSDPDVDPRGFDVALVADLGLFGDAAGLLRRVRRAVGPDGVAIIAARSTAASHAAGLRAFDYYDLFDLVAPEFESVRMVAQLPFHAVALVVLGEEDESPAVSVDTQLADEARVPEAFLVVASQRPGRHERLDPYTIVQLPSERANERAIGREPLARAELRAELLASQLDDLRARMAEGARAIDEAASLGDTVRTQSAQIVDLERALAVRGHELADLSNEVEEMRAAAEAGGVATAQVAEVALRADRAERRVALLEGQLASLGQEVAADARAQEVARIEEHLRARGHAVRELEAELARRDQMVRDLVGTLDELHADPAPAAQASPLPQPSQGGESAGAEENVRLRAQLDALALDLARREGDAHASAWRIAELDRELAQASKVSTVEPSSSHLDRQLAQALDELDALRAALAQEHAARARAESGEELTRARAEIERQAVLLEQLVRAGSDPAPAGFEHVSNDPAGGPSEAREDSR